MFFFTLYPFRVLNGVDGIVSFTIYYDAVRRLLVRSPNLLNALRSFMSYGYTVSIDIAVQKGPWRAVRREGGLINLLDQVFV